MTVQLIQFCHSIHYYKVYFEKRSYKHKEICQILTSIPIPKGRCVNFQWRCKTISREVLSQSFYLVVSTVGNYRSSGVLPRMISGDVNPGLLITALTSVHHLRPRLKIAI
jgi:hypothetical protein